MFLAILFVEIPEPALTGSDVSHVPGSMFFAYPEMIVFPRFFLTIVVVQNVPLRMTDMATVCDVTEGHETG